MTIVANGDNSKSAPPSTLLPMKVYSGSYDGGKGIALRIANGGAGQSGLIGALANAFIDYQVRVNGCEPFQIGWYLGDTTQSLSFIEYRHVDLAVTYNEAAENQCLKNGYAVERVYGFRDHFMLVGPRSNPAGLDSRTDDVLAMFNKITKFGQSNPSTNPPTRFLSRFDKSATNIKESEIFATIGQVPWAHAVSLWYHQYPRFPIEALRAAAALEEYTLTDKGTYTASERSVRDALKVFLIGSDEATDRLLNPARVLRSAYTINERLASDFMKWMRHESGGQSVVRNFAVNNVILYSPAP